MKSLCSFMKTVADELQASGSFGTAHVYRSSLKAILAFNEQRELGFNKLTPEFLKKFEVHLRNRKCSWNTVSTYMRTLRAVYNRAVDRRFASYTPHLFKHVYTGTKADRKRALEKEEMSLLIRELPYSKDLPPELRRAHAYFVLLFLLRGLPFVDLAYLKKSDLKGNTITYRRRKTGRQLTVTLLPEAVELIRKLINPDSKSPYLFPFLRSDENTMEAYREYQLALRQFNYQLTMLRQILGISTELSSYSPRHTWATTAYYCEIHPGIISEAMGHSSITVTETYLKPFRNKKIDDANSMIYSYILR